MMFILIQSRQRNISMWFTVWDQSPIPALNIWNSSSIYLQQTGQDQSRDKKEGPTFLEGSRDSSLRSVSLHLSNKTLYITPTNQRVQWHSHGINTCPCAFLIPFFCFIGVCLFVFVWPFLQSSAFPLMFQVFVYICQAGSGFRTGFHAKTLLYLMKRSE